MKERKNIKIHKTKSGSFRKKKVKKPKGNTNPNFMLSDDKPKRIKKEHQVIRKIRYYWLLDSSLGGCASKNFMGLAGWCHHYFQLNKFNIDKIEKKNVIYEIANHLVGYNPMGSDDYSKEERSKFYATAMLAKECLEAMNKVMFKINFERETEIEWLLSCCYYHKGYDYRCYKCRVMMRTNRSFKDLTRGRSKPIDFSDIYFGPEDLYEEEVEILKGVYSGKEGKVWEKAIKLGKKTKTNLVELMDLDALDIDPTTNKTVLKDLEKAIDKKLRELEN